MPRKKKESQEEKKQNSDVEVSGSGKKKKPEELFHHDKYQWKELNLQELNIKSDYPVYVGIEEIPGFGELTGLRVLFLCKDSSPFEHETVTLQKLYQVATTLGDEKIGSSWLIGDHGPYPFDLERDQPIMEGIPFDEFLKLESQNKVWWRFDIDVGKKPY